MNCVRNSNRQSRIWTAIFNISAKPENKYREHSLAERIAVLTYGFFPIATPVAKHLRGHSVFDGMACSVLRVRTALLGTGLR